MRRGNRARRRLRTLGVEVARLREQLRLADEQLAYVEGVADDARMQAVVSETPLAARDRGEAEEAVRRARAHRDETAGRLRDALAEQDRMLEHMVDTAAEGDRT